MTISSKILYKTIILSGKVVEHTFNKYTKNPAKINTNVLFKILSLNNSSEYGLKYSFNKIKSIEDYKNTVPITNYSDYEEYINKMVNGETNILINYPVTYFGHTSGTTGSQKLIPVTKKAQGFAAKYMAILTPKFCYNNFKSKYTYGRGLMISDIVMTTYTKGGTPICSATSGGMKSIKAILPLMYTSPIEVMEIKDRESSLYLHLLFALKEKNLMYISAVFVSTILDLLRFLEENYKKLIKDIKTGSINPSINIDSKVRKKLKSLLKPDAARADFLEIEFSKGIKGICKRIWPKLIYIATVTGANFSVYDDKVNYYTDNVPIYSTAYAATEAMIGINPSDTTIGYVIIPDTAFFEFIPIEDSNNLAPKTYNINELKINEIYEIVITSYSGLYRYRLGDVIKVIGYYNDCPKIEFLYRKNQILNMVSEKTTEDHLTNSIKNTMQSLNLTLLDYTTLADNSISPGRYVFYIEIQEKASLSLKNKIEKTLDMELRKSNLAYDRFRGKNRLTNLKVQLVKPKTFYRIKELLQSKGISKNQIKIPRVITTNERIKNIINNEIII